MRKGWSPLSLTMYAPVAQLDRATVFELKGAFYVEDSKDCE